MEEEDYYKPVRVDDFYSNNYVEYESSRDSKKPYQSNNPLINLTIFKRYHKWSSKIWCMENSVNSSN